MKTLRQRIALIALIVLAGAAFAPSVIDLLTPAQVYVDRIRATLETRWQIEDVHYVASINALSVFYESNAADYLTEAVQMIRLITASGNLPIREITLNPANTRRILHVLYADVLLFRQGRISEEELKRRITVQ